MSIKEKIEKVLHLHGPEILRCTICWKKIEKDDYVEIHGPVEHPTVFGECHAVEKNGVSKKDESN